MIRIGAGFVSQIMLPWRSYGYRVFKEKEAKPKASLFFKNALYKIRTCDPLIKSQLLYRLS